MVIKVFVALNGTTIAVGGFSYEWEQACMGNG